MKRLLRWSLRILLGFFGLLALYFLAALIGMLIPSNSDFVEPENGIDIYLVTNGIHTDLLLPWNEWYRLLPLEDFEPVNPRYISFGWGDRGFFMDTPSWDDLTIGTTLNAVFLPSESVMHVSLYGFTPGTSESVRKVRISAEQLAQMEAYIRKRFALDENGQVRNFRCCHYPGANDHFYAANGRYHLFNTCNDWANRALQAAGIKTASWAPFDWGIFYHF